MKKLINDVDAVVPEALVGLVRLHAGLALIAEHQIVLRADARDAAARGEVALISGGGAGHEPAHAGYVGAGMLTAAVSGDVFTSPSTDAVLAAIRAVAGPAGVLLIVKNYTGDRLNFGLAAELARADGIAVEMVIVADDVALAADGDHAGRRGIAGTVLVHKLAGAAAASGAPLAAVKGVAERALGNLATMGVALSPCTVPAAGRPGFTLGDDEIELGLGIHGEAGVRRGRIAPATQLIGELVDATVRGLALQAGDRVALLINNLGATATLELQLVVGEAITQLQSRGIRVVRAWSGAFLTALEMAGVSLSLLRIGDDDDLARLDTATQAPAWPAGSAVVPAEPALLAPPAGSALPAGTVPAAVDTPLTRGLERICAALIAAESELTRLDQAVGDGDLGISLARGARAIRDERGGYPPDLPGTLRALSATLRRALGGTSGPLYAIALLRAAAALPVALPATPGAAPGLADVRALGAALAAAADGIAHVGGASEGDRTMLDALIPAARAWQAVADQGGDTVTALTQAIAAARAGSAATAQQIARRGRSSYLGDRVVGHVDPGALAVCLWLEALARADQGIRQS